MSQGSITHVGNLNANPPWIWRREQVIANIDARTNTFFVIDPRTGRRADIAVVRQAGRVPFLRTTRRRRVERQFAFPASMPPITEVDRLDGSVEVTVPVAKRTLVRSAQGRTTWQAAAEANQ
jgi:hypothetical protein